MRKLIAGFILIMTLPIICKADDSVTNKPGVPPAAPNGAQRSEIVPNSSPEALSTGSHPGKTSQSGSADSVDMQSEAFNICLRATQRFDQQEKTKGTGKAAVVPLSASCKTELKPASYWLCMDKEANAEVDFNAAHTRCAQQTKLLN